MVMARTHHELYQELGSIVGTQYVSDDYSVLLSYTKDTSCVPPASAQGVVARPGSTEEVVEIVRLANQTRTPLVPMGGKASISGVPRGQPGRAIIVDMRRMDKVLEIDEANMAVTAQCGITLGEMAGKVNEKGYDIHTAGVPHYINTLGGHISGEPGGGFGRYSYSIGWNYHYLLGVKVVLPNGDIVDTGTGQGSLSQYRGRSWARGMHGPDMAGLFVGDGGMFGVKVEATYRMFRLPKARKGNAYFFDTVDQAFVAYSELWDVDPYLYVQPYTSGMLLGPEYIDMIDPGGEKKWILFFINIGLSEEEVKLKYKIADECYTRHGGKQASPNVVNFTQTFLDFAHDMNNMATMGSVPLLELIVSRRDILDNYKWGREFFFNRLKEKGIDTRMQLITGLLSSGPGYGMTTFIPFLDETDKELHREVYEMWGDFLELSAQRGYVMEATQGHMPRVQARYWTPEFYHFVRTMKKSLDPNNIMNPGVFFA